MNLGRQPNASKACTWVVSHDAEHRHEQLRLQGDFAAAAVECREPGAVDGKVRTRNPYLIPSRRLRGHRHPPRHRQQIRCYTVGEPVLSLPAIRSSLLASSAMVT